MFGRLIMDGRNKPGNDDAERPVMRASAGPTEPVLWISGKRSGFRPHRMNRLASASSRLI